MTAVSAKQAFRGLFLPSASLSPMRAVTQPGTGITLRCFSIRAASRPIVPKQRSILDLYRAKSIATPSPIRYFSLWPSSSPSTPKDDSSLLNQEPSPDAMASGVGQPPQYDSAAQLDSSSIDTSSLQSMSADVASHMADATEKVQTLADLGHLSSWPNVRAAQFVLDWMTEATGLPWWATIALVTIMVRVMVLPLVFKGQANAIRLANISPKMQSHMKDLSYAKNSGNQRLMIESASAAQKLLSENNCHPLKSLITPAVLMPLFITFFFAVRGLAEAGITSMTNGGLFWFVDLTAPDPFVILPALSAAMSLLILETGAEMGGNDQNAMGGQAKIVKNVLRVLTVVFIPVLMNFPAAVFCFWVTNNTFSLVQLFTLKQPAVRKALRLPKKIDHNAGDQPKGKPMGFWESVGAGKSSQTINARRMNDAVPSALQTRRQLEEGREAALQKLVMQQEPQQGGPLEQSLTSSSAARTAAASAPIEATQADEVIIESEEAPAEQVDEKEAANIRREEEKRRRVQEARGKRLKKKRQG